MNKTKITESCYSFQASKPIYNEGKVITAVVSLYLSIPLSILATIGNGLILYAIFATNALQKPPNLLLAFIAITDLLAGIVAMPLSIAIRIMDVKSVLTPCILHIAYQSIAVPLTTVSFLTMGLLSIDSLLACSFPTKYKTWHLKRIYKWIFTISWLLPVSVIVLTRTTSVEADTGKRILSAILSVNVICIVLSNWRIYGIIRTNNSSVGDVLSQAAVEHRRKKQKRLLKTLAAITIFFLVCHLPRTIVHQLQLNEDSLAFYHASRYCSILIFLNSSLNPIIFCYRKEDIRSVVYETLFTVISGVRKGGRITSVELQM